MPRYYRARNCCRTGSNGGSCTVRICQPQSRVDVIRCVVSHKEDALSASRFDAVRMSAGGVDEDAGWYSSMSLVLYVNSFTIYVAAATFLGGLVTFIIITQETAVWIAVTGVWCLQMLVYILSFAIWCPHPIERKSPDISCSEYGRL
jgi:hypothetical protein